MAKPAPTALPHDVYEMYDLLGWPEAYEGESDDEFTQRQLAFETIKLRMADAGMTVNHLAGVLDPVIVNTVSPILLTEPAIQLLDPAAVQHVLDSLK